VVIYAWTAASDLDGAASLRRRGPVCFIRALQHGGGAPGPRAGCARPTGAPAPPGSARRCRAAAMAGCPSPRCGTCAPRTNRRRERSGASARGGRGSADPSAASSGGASGGMRVAADRPGGRSGRAAHESMTLASVMPQPTRGNATAQSPRPGADSSTSAHACASARADAHGAARPARRERQQAGAGSGGPAAVHTPGSPPDLPYVPPVAPAPAAAQAAPGVTRSPPASPRHRSGPASEDSFAA